jgi:hypothetical protein
MDADLRRKIQQHMSEEVTSRIVRTVFRMPGPQFKGVGRKNGRANPPLTGTNVFRRWASDIRRLQDVMVAGNAAFS